jgi:hypothetical protein
MLHPDNRRTAYEIDYRKIGSGQNEKFDVVEEGTPVNLLALLEDGSVDRLYRGEYCANNPS